MYIQATEHDQEAQKPKALNLNDLEIKYGYNSHNRKKKSVSCQNLHVKR